MDLGIIISLIIGFIAGFIVAYIAYHAKEPELGDSLIERQGRQKEENKHRVIALFAQKDQVTNNDVERSLGVSDATATNYLQELEKDGLIRQEGEEGRGVYYTLVKK